MWVHLQSFSLNLLDLRRDRTMCVMLLTSEEINILASLILRDKLPQVVKLISLLQDLHTASGHPALQGPTLQRRKLRIHE